MGRVWLAWKAKAGALKRETYAVYLACRDPCVPWYGRVLAVCVVGYAFSPIDLIAMAGGKPRTGTPRGSS